ncbi:hypothetical protein PQR05_14910 [Paraburkholderia sediminicola]|uniref:Uncharacterized protein n=1 Tax=Paraburkholderia metrosideri TaxID=580937 RepID=A0ABW9E5P2_9BURK
MNQAIYTDIRRVEHVPGFHDAELIGIEHRPDKRELELCFRRVGGERESLRFLGVIALRTVDFAAQNVASRLLISPKYSFSPGEVRNWLEWLGGRVDSRPVAITSEKIEQCFQQLQTGQQSLFVLEPSCGAEMAVLCGSVELKS